MSKQPLLNESTQRRMLLLAGMSHFADEVIAESKKDGLTAEPEYAGGIKDAKGAKGTKGSKKEACAEDDKKKLLEELPQDDLEAAPSAPAPAPALETPAPEGAPATPDISSGDLELETFAKEFAKFLIAQGHDIIFKVDGKNMTGGEEADFGGEADFGEVEEEPAPETGFEAPEPEMGGEEAPEEEPAKPQFESKEKVVAKLVYEEVLKTLAKNAGINLEQARKNGSVQLKLPNSPKKNAK